MVLGDTLPEGALEMKIYAAEFRHGASCCGRDKTGDALIFPPWQSQLGLTADSTPSNTLVSGDSLMNGALVLAH